MSVTTLALPSDPQRNMASWAAVAFVASYSSPGTRQAYADPAASVVRLVCPAPSRTSARGPPPSRGALRARPRGARDLAATTVALKLVVVTGFYRYCVEAQLLAHSPAAHVRRPRICQESARLGLDRSELGAYLVQAGLAGGNDHVLACLLALNALRGSEACSAELSDLALANGHRTVRILGKGAQPG